MFSRELIESFLLDPATKKDIYTVEEKKKILEDLERIRQRVFREKTPRPYIDIDKVPYETYLLAKPKYYASAGAPGAGKSTTLEVFLENLPESIKQHLVYLDPDQCVLKFMYAYLESLTCLAYAKAASNHAALKSAYDTWRAASNYICHTLLREASKREEYSIAHGTTSTSPHIAALYESIQRKGYVITLLLCAANDETRENNIKRRETEQGFVQVDPAEVVSKGKLFPERFDIYFKYADELYFYWNDALCHQKLPTPCAYYRREASGEIHFEIKNQAEWQLFCEKYYQDCKKYKIPVCAAFDLLVSSKKEVAEKIEENMKKSAAVLSSIGLLATEQPRPEREEKVSEEKVYFKMA